MSKHDNYPPGVNDRVIAEFFENDDCEDGEESEDEDDGEGDGRT